jgi:hypothetical protein
MRLGEIKVTIVTCISNLGKTTTAEEKLTQRSLGNKKPRNNGCTSKNKSQDEFRAHSSLETVEAELGLNGIKPPPDKNEEENIRVIAYRNNGHVTLKSTQSVK